MIIFNSQLRTSTASGRMSVKTRSKFKKVANRSRSISDIAHTSGTSCVIILRPKSSRYKMVESFGKLRVLSDVSKYIKTLEEAVQEDIESGILKHIMKPNVIVLTPLVSELLQHYCNVQKGFVINGNLLGITLEDV